MAKNKSTTSQRLLPFFLEEPKERHNVQALVKQVDLEGTPEQVNRRLRCSLGWVGRALLFEHRQLLLKGADGEYWIAQPKLDQAIVEKHLRMHLRRDGSARKRTLMELQVAKERGLLTGSHWRALKDWRKH